MCGLRMPRNPVPRGDAVDRRRARPVVAHEELLELRAQRPERRGVRPARQRRRPPSRFAVRLVEHRERRPVDDHRLIEAPDQILEFLHRHELPRLAEHPGLDLRQRRLAVEMANDVDEPSNGISTGCGTTPAGSCSMTND